MILAGNAVKRLMSQSATQLRESLREGLKVRA
jgi:hypothetical protein